MSASFTSTSSKTLCYHCGEVCADLTVHIDSKYFCCNGCKTVYEILQENQLCEFYNLQEDKKQTLQSLDFIQSQRFAYLDLAEVRSQLIDFSDGQQTKATFQLPQMHCSACIYLLENLSKINGHILQSRVDFPKKQLHITFTEQKISLREVVELLTRVGYEPYISLESTGPLIKPVKIRRKLLARLAVAGFCFGNIMLLSFPEYFGFDSSSVESFKPVFSLLNIALALPVFFFSGWGFLKEAYTGLLHRQFNTDFPLALGMLVLFVRSLYEMSMLQGPGYMDTMTGLVFFLLIGKWFQQQTYDNLRYDRDFTAYFPLAITIKKEGLEEQALVNTLQKNDIILVRNQELIPADSLLLEGEAWIDYSFVTGEAMPVAKKKGDMIYAGGRQIGNRLLLQVLKPVSQSYLTSLWNNEAFSKHKPQQSTIQEAFNKHFTLLLLVIALGAAGSWVLMGDTAKALNAFTAVLIVACPCALVLGSSFAFGTALQMLGKYGFYLKNTQTLESIALTKAIVFDKTGTLTQKKSTQINFVEHPCKLNSVELAALRALVGNSLHPLSRLIYEYLPETQAEPVTLKNFQEHIGQGIEAIIEGHYWKLGSEDFIKGCQNGPADIVKQVWFSVDGLVRGSFEFGSHYRTGITGLMHALRATHDLHLLSGDDAREAPRLIRYFKNEARLHFRQSPADKLEFIKKLQQKNKVVMMLGDGLNDAGALQQSNVGIAVTENIGHFTPASDAILEASRLPYLDRFIRFCQKSVKVVKASLLIAIIYNLIGLGFAVTGTLSPLVSAILMPISSITVVLFTTLLVRFFGKRLHPNFI